MKRMIAFQFELQPKPGQTSRECLAEARGKVATWVSGHLRALGAYDFPLPFDGSAVPARDGHAVRADERHCASHRLVNCEWELVWPPGSSLKWAFSFVGACNAHSVQVALQIHTGWRRFALRPCNESLTGQNPLCSIAELRDALILNGNAAIGDRPVPTRVRKLRKNEVDRFVNEELLDPGRTLPTVLLSLGGPLKATPEGLEEMQMQLLGLAHVAALVDQVAADRAYKALGAAYTSEQVVRIYWPGLSLKSENQSHPYLSLEQMHSQGIRGSNLALAIQSTLAPVAADSFREGKLIRAAREAIAADPARQSSAVSAEQHARLSAEVDQARQAESRWRGEAESSGRHVRALLDELVDLRTQLTALRASLAAGTNVDTALDELAGELDRTWNENKRLRAEFEAARRAAAEVEAEFRGHLEMCSHNEREEPDAPILGRRFDTVLAALRAAAAENTDVLEVWEDADHSAGQSPFARPDQVFAALVAVAQVGRDYFAAREGGPPLGPIEQALRRHVPYKYANFESATTMGHYGGERVFRHHGQSRQMQRHLTLGGGDRNNTLQIYFEFDEGSRRVVIGHCGKHLPISKNRGK